MAARLLERDAQLAAIESAIAAATREAGEVVVVEGDPGSGKTSLLDEAHGLGNASGAGVLRAEAAELEHEYPFGVARQLIEPQLRALSPTERERVLAGAASLAAPLFNSPDLAAYAPALLDPTYATMHGLYWLLANLAESRPLLLLVDDAEWGDPPSLRFIAFLARRVHELPLSLVVAARKVTPETGEPAFLQLMTHGRVDLHRLEPLSASAAGELISRELKIQPQEEFVRAAHEATGGNPFYLRELIREMDRRQVEPKMGGIDRIRALDYDAVSRALLVRLRAASPEVLKVAEAAAVLGDDAEPRLVAELAGVPSTDIAALADEVRRLAVLAPGPRVSFLHPIIRRAVYVAIDDHRRPGLHARAAAMLESVGSPLERVAAQLLQVPPAGNGHTVDVLRGAAANASEQGAFEVAVSQLRRALDEPPEEPVRPRLLVELARAEMLAQDAACVQHLTEASLVATDPQDRFDATLTLGQVLLLDRPEEALGVFERAIEDLTEASPTLALRLKVELAVASNRHPAFGSQVADHLVDAARAGDEGKLDEGDWRRLMAALAIDAIKSNDRVEIALERARAASAGGRFVVQEPPGSLAPWLAAMALMFAEAVDEARRDLDARWEQGLASGSIMECSTAAMMRSVLNYLEARLPEGEADARSALEMAASIGFESGVLIARSVLALVLVEQGDLATARQVLSSCSSGDLEAPNADFGFFARGRLALDAGEWREAADSFIATGVSVRVDGLAYPGLLPWRSSAAVALRHLGELDRARELASEEVRLARAYGGAGALGIALRALGLIHEDEADLDVLEEAVEALGRSPLRLEHARALVEVGAALRRANRRSEARERLAAGYEIAEAAGARVLAQRAATELAALGARPRHLAESGAAALTASERRIVDMAAAGSTNPEIAQALFVSRKTVETHLSSAYRKLGISSRTELAEALSA